MKPTLSLISPLVVAAAASLLPGCGEGVATELASDEESELLTDTSFVAESDARVEAAHPDQAYGGSTRLYVDGSPLESSYLRFTVAGVSGAIQRAVLRLYVSNATVDGPKVFRTTNDWSESLVTWNTRPAPEGVALDDKGAVSSGAWVDFDVTAAVSGNGTFSFVLVATSGDGMDTHSREGSRKPRLVVTVDSPDAGVVARDAGTPPTDAGVPADGGAAPDAGVPADSGVPADGGTPGDSGVTLDAGSSQDGGALPDSLPFPIRATFYYPWFPETWGGTPNPFTHFNPSAGFYRSDNVNVIRSHIQSMQYGKAQAALSSWWGQGHYTDARLGLLLQTAQGTGFRFGIYHEQESTGDPSVAQLNSDLTYIKSRYGSDPAFLRVNGKFVVFAFADAADGCAMVDRWKQANTVGAYVVLKVFPGYATCASQPDAWHQYGPASATHSFPGQSFTISPGFWLATEASPRLARDLVRWKQNIRDMIASKAPWQLVTTFNEWGEGTATESANEWATPSGQGAYLDALHDDGAASCSPTTCAALGKNCGSLVDPCTGTTLNCGGCTAPETCGGGGVANVCGGGTIDAGTQPPPAGSFIFAAAGDIGANARTDSALRAVATSGASFFLALGDMSYDEVVPESSFCDWVKARLGPTYPFQVVGGNHEEDSRVDGFIMNFAACLPDRMGSVGLYARESYFDYQGLVRFISIAADLVIEGQAYDYLPGNAHYDWLVQAIDGARLANIPWVVVTMHKVCLTTGTKSCEVGSGLMNLLISKRVDLVLEGHDHNYQRSKQLSCAAPNSYVASCVSDDGTDGIYPKGAGTVFVIAGAVGRGFYAVNSADTEAGYFTKTMAGETPEAGRGFVRYTVTGNRIDAELIPTGGSTTGDRFSIVK